MILILGLFVISLNSFAQENEMFLNHKNEIEVHYSICHFFDESKTNWLVFDKKRVGFIYDSNGNYIGDKFRVYVPPSYGISFNRNLGKNNKIGISYFKCGRLYPDYNQSKKSGDVIHRLFSVYALKFYQNLIIKNNNRLLIDFSINYKYGSELIHIYYPNKWEDIVENLILKDLGISTGLRNELKLPYNFYFIGEIEYMYFINRFDKGISFFDMFKRATKHTLLINLGISFRF